MADKSRKLWVDVLRTSITLIVIVHHVAMAYPSFSNFDSEVYIRSTHPVVDSNLWIGMDHIIKFNDIYFMSLMFLIGGLFLLKSINRKGKRSFIQDRFKRLFLPFLFLGTFFMLIAYFPAYYQIHHNFDIGFYIKDFFSTQNWPAGPPWFIGLLFCFNVVFALFSTAFEKAASYLEPKIHTLANKPFAFLIISCVVSCFLYIPLALTFGIETWSGIGPLKFQLSRILLYFGYFIIGGLIGAMNFTHSIFSDSKKISQRAEIIFIGYILLFVTYILIGKPLEKMVIDQLLTETTAWVIYNSIFATACAFGCIAMLAIFSKHIHKTNALIQKISENAYMMYLVHYIFVVWSQFLLLNWDVLIAVKFSLSSISSIYLSYVASKQIRRIKRIAKYI